MRQNEHVWSKGLRQEHTVILFLLYIAPSPPWLNIKEDFVESVKVELTAEFVLPWSNFVLIH